MSQENTEPFYLVYWLDGKEVTILKKKHFVRKKRSASSVISEGDEVTAKYNGSNFAAKVVKISVDYEYLDSLHVHKDTGEVIPQSKESPSLDVLAEKKKLSKRKSEADNNRKKVSATLELLSTSNQSEELCEEIPAERGNCNGQCNVCCQAIPFRDLLPQITPEVLKALSSLVNFASAVQPLNEKCTSSDDHITSRGRGVHPWQQGGFNRIEVGQKGSGVWLNAHELSGARSAALNFKKFGDKVFFRRLLLFTLGADELRRMARQHEGASTISKQLFSAIEDAVNKEFHPKKPHGHSYFLRNINNIFARIRASPALKIPEDNTDDFEAEKDMGFSDQEMPTSPEYQKKVESVKKKGASKTKRSLSLGSGPTIRLDHNADFLRDVGLEQPRKKCNGEGGNEKSICNQKNSQTDSSVETQTNFDSRSMENIVENSNNSKSSEMDASKENSEMAREVGTKRTSNKNDAHSENFSESQGTASVKGSSVDDNNSGPPKKKSKSSSKIRPDKSGNFKEKAVVSSGLHQRSESQSHPVPVCNDNQLFHNIPNFQNISDIPDDMRQSFLMWLKNNVSHKQPLSSFQTYQHPIPSYQASHQPIMPPYQGHQSIQPFQSHQHSMSPYPNYQQPPAYQTSHLNDCGPQSVETPSGSEFSFSGTVGRAMSPSFTQLT